MAYEWPREQCNGEGIPYSKLAIVTLERDGELKKFRTQEEVDAAWVDGWHEPGKPETADVPRETRPASSPSIDLNAAGLPTEAVPVHRYEVEPEVNPAPVRKHKGWPKGKPRGPRRKVD